MIESGIISLRHPNSGFPRVVCYCECGGECDPNGIYSHVKTKRHRAFVASRQPQTPPRECDICYETKSSFFTCKTCSKEHCRDCYSTIKKATGVHSVCPFCRASFRRRRPKQSSEPSVSRTHRVVSFFKRMIHLLTSIED